MTSQAQAVQPLDAVRGLAFFGFPLHPAGKPSIERSVHLLDVRVPMLFLQGTRDELAEIGLIEGVVAGLGNDASLFTLDGADHSFHVPAKSGRKDSQVLNEMLDSAATWMRKVVKND